MASTMAASCASGKPSSRMKLALRNFGSAPETARSLTVPFTASSPIDPPGKNSGCTTNESVLMREPRAGGLKHRGVAQIFKSGIAERGQKQMLDQLVAQLAAAAVAHHDGGIVGQRQRAGPVGEIGCGNFYVVSHAQPPKARSPRWPALRPKESGRSCNTRRRRLRLKPWSRRADGAACIPCRRPRTRPA